MPPQQTLTTLLEQYLFSVAATYIDLIEPETQDQLIRFINRINTGSTSPDSPEMPVNVSPRAGASQTTESVARQLEKQWEHALLQISPSDIHLTERNATSIRLMTIRQANIESTISSINKVDLLLEKANRHVLGQTRKVIIITHYELIRNRYSLYLAKLEELQEKELTRLKQYPY